MDMLERAGIRISHEMILVCEACHRYIEGDKPHACQTFKLGEFVTYREELVRIDNFVKDVRRNHASESD